jgi:hypothetical protein
LEIGRDQNKNTSYTIASEQNKATFTQSQPVVRDEDISRSVADKLVLRYAKTHSMDGKLRQGAASDIPSLGKLERLLATVVRQCERVLPDLDYKYWFVERLASLLKLKPQSFGRGFTIFDPAQRPAEPEPVQDAQSEPETADISDDEIFL